MAAFDRIRCGFPELDVILDYIRLGDNVVWQVTDIFNGLMAVPNLAALVLLVGEIDAPGEKERDTGKRETAE